MRTENAKYLLRFDDLCPTMNWKAWSEIEAALIEHRVKPILAVVPDNQDPMLRVNAAAEDFWERVRQWQGRGWTIALHGYQHKYGATPGNGMITGRKKTEFAGVPASEQEQRLRRGLKIFEREGIRTNVWIAPSNSFDYATIRLLPRFGIYIICDGCFRFPFVDRQNLVWVPQQLHCFRPAPPGVWTVCFHHNYWTAADIDRFKEGLRQFQADIQALENVIRDWGKRHSWWSYWLCTNPRVSHRLIRMELKLWEWSRGRKSKHNQPSPPKKTIEPAERSSVASLKTSA